MRTILFLIRKETLQVLRDRIMLVQVFVLPVIQLLVLVQAMTFEVTHTDLALVDLDRSPASERLVERFTATGRFSTTLYTASEHVADEALLTRRANAILRVPPGFDRDLHRGRSPEVQLVLNAEDGAAAGVVQAYASQIIASFSRSEAGPRASLSASRQTTRGRPAVAVHTRRLVNPQASYFAYMAIGLLAALMTLVGILLASQNIAREKEIGTLEQLNVTPITPRQFIIGKLAPFWVLGLIELTVGLLVLRFVYALPFAGSVSLVYLGASVYLLAALGLGLLVSTVARTQQQAQFVAFFVIVTFFFLGGIFTPVLSMPEWAQAVASLNPTEHFVTLLRTVLIRGGRLADVVVDLGAMSVFAVVALSLAAARFRKTVA